MRAKTQFSWKQKVRLLKEWQLAPANSSKNLQSGKLPNQKLKCYKISKKIHLRLWKNKHSSSKGHKAMNNLKMRKRNPKTCCLTKNTTKRLISLRETIGLQWVWLKKSCTAIFHPRLAWWTATATTGKLKKSSKSFWNKKLKKRKKKALTSKVCNKWKITFVKGIKKHRINSNLSRRKPRKFNKNLIWWLWRKKKEAQVALSKLFFHLGTEWMTLPNYTKRFRRKCHLQHYINALDSTPWKSSKSLKKVNCQATTSVPVTCNQAKENLLKSIRSL